MLVGKPGRQIGDRAGAVVKIVNLRRAHLGHHHEGRPEIIRRQSPERYLPGNDLVAGTGIDGADPARSNFGMVNIFDLFQRTLIEILQPAQHLLR